jgi:SulP family sulfate permease
MSRLPGVLLIAIAVSALADLAGQGVAVVGAIQPGLPPVGLPAVGLADLAGLAGPALGMAFLVYADSGVTGEVLGRRGGYAVAGSQEFLVSGPRTRALR